MDETMMAYFHAQMYMLHSQMAGLHQNMQQLHIQMAQDNYRMYLHHAGGNPMMQMPGVAAPMAVPCGTIPIGDSTSNANFYDEVMESDIE